MVILNIDTTTACCSAAVTIDGQVLAQRLDRCNGNHIRELPLFVDELLTLVREKGLALDAVALSQGPGSYTGLRISSGIAKGLCYGMNVPLIPVDTLQLLCQAAVSKTKDLPTNALLCPMVDARRMEVYTAVYDPLTLHRTTDITAQVVDAHTFEALLATRPVVFFGNGAAKCQTVITSPNARCLQDIVPEAQYLGALAEQVATRLDCKQMAYFEPFYLKEFVPAPSHIKGLY